MAHHAYDIKRFPLCNVRNVNGIIWALSFHSIYQAPDHVHHMVVIPPAQEECQAPLKSGSG